MRPDVAAAFDRMAAAARAEAVLTLLITSGYRADVEQARLFAAQPSPHLFLVVEPHPRQRFNSLAPR
jgi:LAS superfamily LD-carboxypeptidase LdcB